MESLQIKPENLIYKALIGVGGIGTGKFFALQGDHTLGREESRAGHFLEQRDYCKLHIITHYVQTLLGTAFHTIPIGRVGDDGEGRQLIDEMSAVGLDVQHVELIPGGQTLFSFCFVYPDGSGGNMTTDNSVNSTVDAALVDKATPLFQTYRGQGIALAAPEAPLSTRLHLLERATQRDFFRAASLTSSEITSQEGISILSLTDLLAINIDEAASLAGLNPDETEVEQVVKMAVDAALKYQENMLISITAGKKGSWVWDNHRLNHVPAIGVDAVNTAGAGDAHFAALLVGLTAGLTPHQSQELATLVAALSVQSQHTIHPALHRAALEKFAKQYAPSLGDNITQLLR